MNKLSAFQEHVGMKFQIYNGLFLNLPFSDVQSSGILLPVFTTFCLDGLEEGRSPLELVEEFFTQRAGIETFASMKDDLFRFLRLAERQVVLFDALEDSAFTNIVDTAGPGSIKYVLNRIEREEKNPEIREFLKDYRVRIVLTAHPTQFYTDQVLSILMDLGTSLKENNLNEINNLLMQMGNTRFKKSEKPSPLDEAQSLMWIMENIMFDVIPEIHSKLAGNAWNSGEESLGLPGILELGFWPGGDRDGNPFVNTETTKQVGRMLRGSVLRLYLRELKHLSRRLTFDGVLEKIEAISERLENTINPVSRLQDSQELYDEKATEQKGFYVEMSDDGYHSARELLGDILELRQDIVSRHRGLFVELLDDLIFKIQCFGFHFASIDIRQDSGLHEELMADLFSILPALQPALGKLPGYGGLEENQRRTLLLSLTQTLGALPPGKLQLLYEQILEQLSDSTKRDCLQSFRVIGDIQSRNGEAGSHRYIISHCEKVSHILETWVMAILSGFNIDMMPIDFVPLFETIEDLNNAPEIMSTLYKIDSYRNHLSNRNNRQHMMLGFSDGTKDGGYVTANWEIYKAKESLTGVTREAGFRVVFFDGRGGPPGRGGGSTHKFYRGLGDKIDSSNIHLTVQGQTISSRYGTADIATHNLGQLVSAGVEHNLFPSDNTLLSAGDRELIQRLSDRAQTRYMELRNHRSFLPYLEDMTPLKYYGRTNIGSRPSKRSQSGPLNLDSLRAIPFVGAWSQMKQNVPGYFGLGTALKSLIDDGKEDDLRLLHHHSLFFRTLLENSMQSLSKVYFPLTAYLKEDAEFGDFWKILADEAQLTRTMLERICGHDSLLQNDPVVKESIKMRERMILPVMVIQQYALQKLRQLESPTENIRFRDKDKENQKDSLEKLIIKSLMASINALRNSV